MKNYPDMDVIPVQEEFSGIKLVDQADCHMAWNIDIRDMSRKLKKRIFGTRISKSRMKKYLSKVRVVKNKYPQPATILPFPFCPKCGCTITNSSGNMASYPEIWEKIECARCGWLVEVADNSPYYHCLEYPPNYEID